MQNLQQKYNDAKSARHMNIVAPALIVIGAIGLGIKFWAPDNSIENGSTVIPEIDRNFSVAVFDVDTFPNNDNLGTGVELVNKAGEIQNVSSISCSEAVLRGSEKGAIGSCNVKVGDKYFTTDALPDALVRQP